MIVNFISEETIGSSLNGSVVPPDFEAWFERNKDKFEPKEHSGFLSSLRSRDTTVMIVFLPYFRAGKYDLRYGKDATHVLSQTISPTGVYGGELGGKQAMKIEATVGFDLAALVDGEVRKETTTGTVGYSVLKDPDTGKWLISGFTNTFSTIPLK